MGVGLREGRATSQVRQGRQWGDREERNACLWEGEHACEPAAVINRSPAVR